MAERNIIGLGVEDIIGNHRGAILKLVAEYGASNVQIFGSVARGEVTPESDVNVLVSFPPDRNIFDLIGLWLDLKDLLGREMDLSTDGSFKEYVRSSALRDVVPL
jgi:predicted nucleotidyltransferase